MVADPCFKSSLIPPVKGRLLVETSFNSKRVASGEAAPFECVGGAGMFEVKKPQNVSDAKSIQTRLQLVFLQLKELVSPVRKQLYPCVSKS